MSAQSSRSARTTCWPWATIRVFTVVGLSGPAARRCATTPARIECLAQEIRGPVATHDAGQHRGTAEGPHVARDVGGTAQMEALPLHLHDGHRSLGRDARHLPPEELVEHHVAEDDDARSPHRPEQGPAPASGSPAGNREQRALATQRVGQGGHQQEEHQHFGVAEIVLEQSRHHDREPRGQGRDRHPGTAPPVG